MRRERGGSLAVEKFPGKIKAPPRDAGGEYGGSNV